MHKDSDEDEDDLFQQAMQDVIPIKAADRANPRPPRKPLRVKQAREQSAMADVFSDADLTEACPETLSFARDGVQPATLKKLRQGKLAYEMEIDLHGMTVDAARQYLRDFLAECNQAGSRVVHIVHGKGYRSKDGPVIKGMVNRWLRQLPQVLAFHSAIPADGGTGAVTVLLKKQ